MVIVVLAVVVNVMLVVIQREMGGDRGVSSDDRTAFW